MSDAPSLSTTTKYENFSKTNQKNQQTPPTQNHHKWNFKAGAGTSSLQILRELQEKDTFEMRFEKNIKFSHKYLMEKDMRTKSSPIKSNQSAECTTFQIALFDSQ